ncbi:hypothetical protein ACJIZ3_010697 [Penstemon smallii]|uniref:FAS1 domain-containing protein n=1 Tax=Penstemon smallii TaxID=265156 RepID=A0ABD3UKL3_9LAMI
MASPLTSIFILSLSSILFSLLLTQSAPIDIISILEKSGNYTFFIRLLKETQVAAQINNQINNSYDGITVFAPTDNAFKDLPAGTINSLTLQQHVQLVLYHITPKYYSLDNFKWVSSPVKTQASGQDGAVWGLYFSTGKGDKVNVSTGIVDVPIYNIAVWRDLDLLFVVYQVDKVLLPREFYEARAPAVSPPSRGGKGTGDTGGPAISPTTGRRRKGPSKVPAYSPAFSPEYSPTSPPSRGGDGNGDLGGAARAPVMGDPGNGSGRMNVGFGLVTAIWLCMGLFLSRG